MSPKCEDCHHDETIMKLTRDIGRLEGKFTSIETIANSMAEIAKNTGSISSEITNLEKNQGDFKIDFKNDSDALWKIIHEMKDMMVKNNNVFLEYKGQTDKELAKHAIKWSIVASVVMAIFMAIAKELWSV